MLDIRYGFVALVGRVTSLAALLAIIFRTSFFTAALVTIASSSTSLLALLLLVTVVGLDAWVLKGGRDLLTPSLFDVLGILDGHSRMIVASEEMRAAVVMAVSLTRPTDLLLRGCLNQVGNGLWAIFEYPPSCLAVFVAFILGDEVADLVLADHKVTGVLALGFCVLISITKPLIVHLNPISYMRQIHLSRAT
jgi:hypothetical protein